MGGGGGGRSVAIVTSSGLKKAELSNVFLSTLLKLNNIVKPELDVPMLNNTVDNIE